MPKENTGEIDKVRRGFLWAGKATAHGGSCMGVWRPGRARPRADGHCTEIALVLATTHVFGRTVARTEHSFISEGEHLCGGLYHLHGGQWSIHFVLGGQLARRVCSSFLRRHASSAGERSLKLSLVAGGSETSRESSGVNALLEYLCL